MGHEGPNGLIRLSYTVSDNVAQGTTTKPKVMPLTKSQPPCEVGPEVNNLQKEIVDGCLQAPSESEESAKQNDFNLECCLAVGVCCWDLLHPHSKFQA